MSKFLLWYTVLGQIMAAAVLFYEDTKSIYSYAASSFVLYVLFIMYHLEVKQKPSLFNQIFSWPWLVTRRYISTPTEISILSLKLTPQKLIRLLVTNYGQELHSKLNESGTCWPPYILWQRDKHLQSRWRNYQHNRQSWLNFTVNILVAGNSD